MFWEEIFLQSYRRGLIKRTGSGQAYLKSKQTGFSGAGEVFGTSWNISNKKGPIKTFFILRAWYHAFGCSVWTSGDGGSC